MSDQRQGGSDFLWIVVLLVFGGFIAYGFYEDSRPHVFPRLRGRVEQPLLGHPVLVLTVFHQHPGNLRRGRLQVTLSGPQGENSRGSETQTHSFELWEPNEDRAVVLRFPLGHYDPEQEIPLSFSIQATGIQDSVYEDAWSGRGWSSAQK